VRMFTKNGCVFISLRYYFVAIQFRFRFSISFVFILVRFRYLICFVFLFSLYTQVTLRNGRFVQKIEKILKALRKFQEIVTKCSHLLRKRQFFAQPIFSYHFFLLFVFILFLKRERDDKHNG
jgi:hypothetical protein